MRRSSKPRGQSIWVTGEAIDWRLYLVTALAWPLSLAPTSMQSPALSAGQTLALLASFSFGHFSLIFLLSVGKRTIWRWRLTRRVPSLALWFIFFATMASAILAHGVFTSITSNPAPLPLELALLRFALLAVMFAGMANLHRFRTALSELDENQRNLIGLLELARQRSEVELTHVVDRVRGLIGDVRDSARLTQSEQARLLHNLSEAVVRPWSHELAQRAEPLAAPPRERIWPDWHRVIEGVFKKSLIRPLPIAAFVALFAILYSVRSPAELDDSAGPPANVGGEFQVVFDGASFIESVVQLGSIFAATFAAALSVRKVLDSQRLRAKPQSAISAELLGLASLTLAAALILAGLFKGYEVALGWELDWVGSPGALVVLVLPIFGIALLVGASRAVAEATGSILNQLTATNQGLRWELARANQELWLFRRTLANKLHGPIRAALLAAMLRLGNEPESRDQIVETLEHWLVAAADRLGEQSEGDQPLELLHSTVKLWSGTCEVSIVAAALDLDAVAQDQPVANLVGEIVSEAVTNAVVHAGATAVLVELDINDQLLRLSVSNEGELPDGYSPGLGLRLLDESTLSWGISNQGGRTVLTAELPLTSAATPLA